MKFVQKVTGGARKTTRMQRASRTLHHTHKRDISSLMAFSKVKPQEIETPPVLSQFGYAKVLSDVNELTSKAYELMKNEAEIREKIDNPQIRPSFKNNDIKQFTREVQKVLIKAEQTKKSLDSYNSEEQFTNTKTEKYRAGIEDQLQDTLGTLKELINGLEPELEKLQAEYGDPTAFENLEYKVGELLEKAEKSIPEFTEKQIAEAKKSNKWKIILGLIGVCTLLGVYQGMNEYDELKDKALAKLEKDGISQEDKEKITSCIDIIASQDLSPEMRTAIYKEISNMVDEMDAINRKNQKDYWTKVCTPGGNVDIVKFTDKMLSDGPKAAIDVIADETILACQAKFNNGTADFVDISKDFIAKSYKVAAQIGSSPVESISVGTNLSGHVKSFTIMGLAAADAAYTKDAALGAMKSYAMSI